MRHVVMVVAAMAALGGALPAMAGGGRQVDPRAMERAAAVARPGPIDARVVGAWDVWIPGSVYYLSDGRRVTGHYQPGAAMNRLEIAADGGYRWGTRRGRLEEVLPWHAQPGRRYYRVAHASGDEYEFHHGDGDTLVVLFGGVGGHAATGTRLAGAGPATTTAPASRPAPTAGSHGPAAGAHVRILWSGSWYPGRVLRVDGDRYLVSYDGYGSSWDEWVDASRLRASDGDARGNALAPAAPGGTAGNPLGVEWQSSTQGAPPPAAGPATH